MFLTLPTQPYHSSIGGRYDGLPNFPITFPNPGTNTDGNLCPETPSPYRPVPSSDAHALPPFPVESSNLEASTDCNPCHENPSLWSPHRDPSRVVLPSFHEAFPNLGTDTDGNLFPASPSWRSMVQPPVTLPPFPVEPPKLVTNTDGDPCHETPSFWSPDKDPSRVVLPSFHEAFPNSGTDTDGHLFTAPPSWPHTGRPPVTLPPVPVESSKLVTNTDENPCHETPSFWSPDRDPSRVVLPSFHEAFPNLGTNTDDNLFPASPSWRNTVRPQVALPPSKFLLSTALKQTFGTYPVDVNTQVGDSITPVQSDICGLRVLSVPTPQTVNSRGTILN